MKRIFFSRFNSFAFLFSPRILVKKKSIVRMQRFEEIKNGILILDFRQCFQLFAPQGYVDTADKLCFIMRSLSMAPTIAELKRYFLRYKKGFFILIMNSH